MTAFIVRRSRLLVLLALGALASFVSQRGALAADPVPVSSTREPVIVHLDQAKLLKLPERTSTLVIGNPLIADAVVQPGGVIVVTAKSYGMTNLVALDRTGTALAEYPIQVVGPSDAVVVVYRGIERESYSCAPYCERRITLGDTPAYFNQNMTAFGLYTAQSQGLQQQQSK
jgi:Pilus formation protein N terminal region